MKVEFPVVLTLELLPPVRFDISEDYSKYSSEIVTNRVIDQTRRLSPALPINYTDWTGTDCDRDLIPFQHVCNIIPAAALCLNSHSRYYLLIQLPTN